MPIRVAEGIARPNGVQLSRDERVLYVSDTNGISALAFDILPDGTLSNRRTFATYAGRVANAPAGSPASGGDGIVIDSEGRFLDHRGWNRDIHSFGPAGRHHPGILFGFRRPLPGSCFGGPDKRTLYVAGQGTL